MGGGVLFFLAPLSILGEGPFTQYSKNIYEVYMDSLLAQQEVYKPDSWELLSSC